MLAKLKISTKVISLTLLLLVSPLVLSIVSIIQTRTLSKDLGNALERSSEIQAVGQIERFMIELNRSEYRLAAKPEDYDILLETLGPRKKGFEEGINKALKTASSEQAELLRQISDAFRAYSLELDKTMEVTKRNKSRQLGDEQKVIMTEVENSRSKADLLQALVKEYTILTNREQVDSTVRSQAQADLVEKGTIATAMFFLLTGSSLGWLIGRRGISAPLTSAVECLRKLATGDLAVKIFGLERKDEVGDIAHALAVFQQNARERQGMQAEHARDAAEKLARAEAVDELVRSFERQTGSAVQIISSAASELEATANSLAAAAKETSSQSGIAEMAAMQTATNVETVAAATEELGATVKEVARQMEGARRVALNATQEAESAQSRVAALTESGQKISHVIGLIQDIASQTNLLALNATIEAARAGDAGKGFAVVASEVKALANQTAQATDEIRTQVDAMHATITGAVSAIQSIGAIIVQLNDMAGAVADGVQQQSAATSEIGRNALQAANGTGEVTNNITGIQQAAQMTASGSNQVLGAAREVAERVISLKNDIDRFVAGVRSV